MGMLTPHGLCNSKACKAEDDTAHALHAFSLVLMVNSHTACCSCAAGQCFWYVDASQWSTLPGEQAADKVPQRKEAAHQSWRLTSQALSALALH